MVRKGFIKLVLTSFLLVLAVVCNGVQARELATTSAVDTTVALSQLPPQGIEIYRLIHQGGPFPFGKDGVVFGNRERLLPAEKRGYYREYTVKTPRSGDRGARRIVCGGPAAAPDTCFYTADHYASFRKIVP
ncbi:MAG: ribonuclease [Burkholderiales bacterium]